MSAATRPAQPPSAATADGTAPADAGRGPLVALLGGVALVALAVGLFNLRIRNFILDETVIKQSAVHYSQGLPYNFFHDVNARATSRLYSLIISPLFGWFHGDVGVRATRSLNAPLFASAAIPVYLLAREVLRSRAMAVASGLAAIVFPWLVLTTAIFTENLAYPLVCWAVLAMAWVFIRPAARYDALVIALLVLVGLTRTQMAALGGGYVILVAVRLWLDRVPDRRAWATQSVRRFPALTACVALAILAGLALLARGTLDDHLRSVLGSYASSTTDRGTLPVNALEGTLIEVLAVSLGVGVLPAIVAAAWYPRAVAGRFGPSAQGVGLAVVAGIGVLWAVTMYAQGGFAGTASEERYYFYLAPFLWVGALAALQDAERMRARDLLEAGALLAVLAAAIPLPRDFRDPEASYFAPAMSTVNWLSGQVGKAFADVTGRSGLAEADILGVAVALVAILAWWMRRRGGQRALAGLLIAGAAAQVLLLGVAVANIDGLIQGPTKRTTGTPPATLGFIDRATGDRPVTWFDNQVRVDDDQATIIQRLALLYNDQIRQRLAVPLPQVTPDNFPLNSLPIGGARPGPAGAVVPAPPIPVRTPFYVQSFDSPLAQLDAKTVRRDPSGTRLEVVRAATDPARLTWLAQGVAATGAIAPGKVAALRSWGAHRITLTLVAGPAPARVRVVLGRARTVRIAAGATATVAVDVTGAAQGTLRTDAPATLASVAVAPPAG